jgi:hypothetical protein
MQWIERPGGTPDASVALQAQVDPGNHFGQRASIHGSEQDPDETCDHIQFVLRKERGLKRIPSRRSEVGFGTARTERRGACRQRVTQMLH